MSSTWGNLTWGIGFYGQQASNEPIATGSALSISVGAIATEVNDSYGLLAWGQGTWGIQGAGEATVTGVSASTSAGQIAAVFPDHTEVLTGLAMTSSIGTAAGSFLLGWGRFAWGDFDWGEANAANEIVSGLSLTTSAGQLGFLGDSIIPVDGQALTATIGNGIPVIDVSFAVSGVSSTTAVGSVEGVAGYTPANATATTSIGSVTLFGNADVPVTGLSLTTGVGTVEQITLYDATGVAVTSSLGIVDPIAKYPVTGLSLTTGTEDPGTTISVDFTVSGVTAQTSVGNTFAFVWSEINPNVTNRWDEVETAA